MAKFISEAVRIKAETYMEICGSLIQAQMFGRKNNSPFRFFDERYGAKAMVLNGKAYIIAGWKQSGSPLELQDVWEYDPTLNTYNKKNLPATFTGRYAYVAFTIGNKGYMGLGYGTWRDDFASYDPSTDTWTNLANFPGAARILRHRHLLLVTTVMLALAFNPLILKIFISIIHQTIHGRHYLPFQAIIDQVLWGLH